MGTFWEKLKFWTKAISFGVAVLYLFIVMALNWNLVIDGDLNLIVAKYQKPHVLTVLLVTAVISIFGWWLLRTIFKTLRQWQHLQDRSRTARLEKEMAEMKAKAGMLQTREAPAAATTNTPAPSPSAPPVVKPVDDPSI
jgi:hypothetical protein